MSVANISRMRPASSYGSKIPLFMGNTRPSWNLMKGSDTRYRVFFPSGLSTGRSLAIIPIPSRVLRWVATVGPSRPVNCATSETLVFPEATASMTV